MKVINIFTNEVKEVLLLKNGEAVVNLNDGTANLAVLTSDSISLLVLANVPIINVTYL